MPACEIYACASPRGQTSGRLSCAEMYRKSRLVAFRRVLVAYARLRVLRAELVHWRLGRPPSRQHARNIGLRSAAVNPQRRMTAEMFGAGLTQFQSTAKALDRRWHAHPKGARRTPPLAKHVALAGEIPMPRPCAAVSDQTGVYLVSSSKSAG